MKSLTFSALLNCSTISEKSARPSPLTPRPTGPSSIAPVDRSASPPTCRLPVGNQAGSAIPRARYGRGGFSLRPDRLAADRAAPLPECRGPAPRSRDADAVHRRAVYSVAADAHGTQQLWDEWRSLETDIAAVTKEIEAIAAVDEGCQRLLAIPGVGPLVATALVAAVADGTGFKRGRDLAAWLGLVPRQHSTGGKSRLLGMSKRGNSHLRRLFIHGARSASLHTKRDNGLGPWLDQLEMRTHKNVAVVALANKIVRISWAVLARQEEYRQPMPIAA